MIFDPKSKKNQKFMITAAQLDHLGYILAVICFLIWSFSNKFMKGTSKNDKNKRLFFYVAVILFIGIACLIKLNIIQVMKLSK